MTSWGQRAEIGQAGREPLRAFRVRSFELEANSSGAVPPTHGRPRL